AWEEPSEGEGEGEGEGEPGEGEEGEECEPETPPYPIGRIDKTYYDPARGNRAVPVKLYYPGAYAGDGPPVAGPACRRFPVVVFGHGYQTNIGYYDYLWQAIVPNGYIMALVDTYNEVTWDFPDFGRDLAFVATAIAEEGATPASLFHARVSPMTAVMGHSMGGGAAILAARNNPLIHAVIGLAPSHVDAAVLQGAYDVYSPSLIMGSEKDCIVRGHGSAIYGNIPATCKYYVEIVKGSHCAFAQDARVCEYAEIVACIGTSWISDSAQRALILTFVPPWLDATLKARPEALDTFRARLAEQTAAGAVTHAAQCPSLLTLLAS
ncbi:MAG TPA: hypothetical protein PKL84_08460, partial [Candidatus Hydrogenedentes bacterium]|nr:hypothetical protein [Candidatus Hydrogenedentota bacterium]